MEKIYMDKKESGNSIVENVIILPLIFIVICGLISMCFLLHDKATLEAAARRGALYAAHCISDPNYASILQQSGNEAGSLDISVANNADFRFSGLGKNIHPYRYLQKKTEGLDRLVEAETGRIVEKTRLPISTIHVVKITCDQVNKVYYQDVAVTIQASYPLPYLMRIIGLPDSYDYTITARMAVNDPDEFIRNADLAVDIIEMVDDATGNHLEKAKQKIGLLTQKIKQFFVTK